MIDALKDEDIDRSDLPPLDDNFFAKAKWRLPNEPVPVTVHLDADLYAWFQAQGNDYEQRMIAALRIYAEAHKKFRPQIAPAS